MFILNKSDGFTRPRVKRLNDSIQMYVWAILGTQAQTHTGILGTGTAFDVQKQFLANIEDAISSPVDLPPAISRYQDVLQYACSEVNFSFGASLYMAPSNMLLCIGNMAGYNNLIIVTTDAQSLGLNSGLNRHEVSVAPPDATNDTGEGGLIQPVTVTQPPGPAASESMLGKQVIATAYSNSDHKDKKTALIVGGVLASLLVLWLLRQLCYQPLMCCHKQ